MPQSKKPRKRRNPVKQAPGPVKDRPISHAGCANIMMAVGQAMHAFGYKHPITGKSMSIPASFVCHYVAGWNDCAGHTRRHKRPPPLWTVTADVVQQVDDGAGPDRGDRALALLKRIFEVGDMPYGVCDMVADIENDGTRVSYGTLMQSLLEEAGLLAVAEKPADVTDEEPS